ncbi:MAG: hypothetical protein J1E98_13110 [Lachnospiraceae bacterium]|nr:hypothetical protein [Lachnospiraceae bacterium]
MHKKKMILSPKFFIYLITLLIHVIVIPFYNVTIIPDEINPLALGYMLRGEDWTQYLISDGHYYKYGQLLIRLPLVLLIKNNYILYRALLLENAFVVSFIPVCVYVILTEYWGCKKVEKSFQIAIMIGFIPSVLLNNKFVWSEPLLFVIPWIIMILFLKILKQDISDSEKWIYSVMIAVLQVYAYMVHTRGIVILIASLLCTIIMRFVIKEKNIKFIPYLGVTAILCFVDSVLGTIIRNHMYNGVEDLAGGTTSFINSEFIHNVMSVSGLKLLGEEIAGWLYVSVSSTFGLTGLGLVISIVLLVNARKWSEYSKQELIIVLFGMLLFCGSLMIGVLFFFNDLFEYAEIEIIRRGDRLIYARYLDPASVCISFIGLYYLLVKKSTSTKFCVFYSGLSFILLQGFFVSKIADRINNTIIWAQNLMTVNYLCDIKQSLRSGAYSTVGRLSSGIAIFGMIAVMIYIISMMYHKKNRVFFLINISCFLVCYFWNAYNVIYRLDSYQTNIIKEYENIIRCVNEEEELKNIYLDDEILRSSFQYIYSDYYVVTRRDDNRFSVEEMFILSPAGTYNKALYDNDYYEIVDSENINEDYHLYIKGERLNRTLNENGYATREVSGLEVQE